MTVLRALAVAGLLPASAGAETLLKVDASAPVVAPVSGHLKLGSNVSPTKGKLDINNQYVVRDGKPWFPVMGEFHYSRSPASQWESELRKMKSAGIQVVASYVIWNHHEEEEGKFNWTERRNLRQFIELCAKVGLDAMVRIGPWAHGEVRYGGVPDWVVDTMPTRGNDPQYLLHVERLYGQIGQQLRGLMWKDGGPVIGVQLENEYNLRGPGEGAEHISELKRLAIKSGLDAPFYTVTGWDGAVYPPGEVTPVFGGYADEPWSRSTTELPPKETHAFRFSSRVSGNLGAQTASRGRGTADLEIDKTPFFGAEYGPGLPFMYRRRPVVSPDDIASMLPVQLGSGVNLLGYYMFHGGRNPQGRTWLQESTGSGGHNDTTWINYDFQAPLGPDGQQRPVLEYLRPYHLFLKDFGTKLATMTVRKPELVPENPADLKTPRFSVRSNGASGFLFVNNYVRQYAAATHQDVRFSVKLPGETVVFPSRPVTVRNGDYFIWPFNLDLDGVTLRYASVQPVARVEDGNKGVLYVFAATGGIDPELAFDAALAPSIKARGAKLTTVDGKLVVGGFKAGTGEVMSIARSGAPTVRIVVLSAEQARHVSVEQLAGAPHLLYSRQQVLVEADGLALRSPGQPNFRFGLFPRLSRTPAASTALAATGSDGVFQSFEASLPLRRIEATVTAVRAARAAPRILVGGLARAALEPSPEAFKAAASWTVSIPREQLKDLGKDLDEALLEIDFVGDVGRLFSGVRMLDDWYYSGYGWQYGLRQSEALLDRPLTVSVLPLRADAPVYIPREARPDFGGKDQMAELRKVSVTPVYVLKLKP